MESTLNVIKRKWATNVRWSTTNRKRVGKPRGFFDDSEIPNRKKRKKRKQQQRQLPTTITTEETIKTSETATNNIISLPLSTFKEGIMNSVLQCLHIRKAKFKVSIPAFPDAFFLPVFGKRRMKKCRKTFQIQSFKISMQGKSFLFSDDNLINLFSDVKPSWNISTFVSSSNDNLSLSITSLQIKYCSSPVGLLILQGKYKKTINNQ